MFYNGENPILKIVGVEHASWQAATFQVKPRAYSALAFRIKGEAEMECGGEDYTVHSNEILYMPQNLGYTARYSDTEMIVVHFVAAEDDGAPEVYSFENSERLYKEFLQLHALWKKKEPGYLVYSLAQLYQILGTLLEQQTKAVLPAHFLKAVSLLNAGFLEQELCVDQICRRAAIHPAIFRRLFREHYGKTPTAYITDLRLEYARTLIASGMAVESAAYESGFNDPKYFARVVKRRLGCTPRSLKEYGR